MLVFLTTPIHLRRAMTASKKKGEGGGGRKESEG
jgi:hypothetical protein